MALSFPWVVDAVAVVFIGMLPDKSALGRRPVSADPDHFLA